jgi:hypothetical protein
MADKPKAAAKAPSGPSLEMMILGAVFLFVLIFMVVIPAVLTAFNVEVDSLLNLSTIKEIIITFISKLFTTITFVSVFVSLLCLLLMLYIKAKKEQVMHTWEQSKRVLEVGQQPAVAGAGPASPEFVLPGSVETTVHGPQANAGNEKWLDVESKINSANPSDWRLAILEADILLDEMLIQMGLAGGSLGERLKSAHHSFFATLDEAWTAHKIRNIIAHQGSSYELTYGEARKAIDLYRRVFEEFYFI